MELQLRSFMLFNVQLLVEVQFSKWIIIFESKIKQTFKSKHLKKDGLLVTVFN